MHIRRAIPPPHRHIRDPSPVFRKARSEPPSAEKSTVRRSNRELYPGQRAAFLLQRLRCRSPTALHLCAAGQEEFFGASQRHHAHSPNPPPQLDQTAPGGPMKKKPGLSSQVSCGASAGVIAAALACMLAATTGSWARSSGAPSVGEGRPLLLGQAGGACPLHDKVNPAHSPIKKTKKTPPTDRALALQRKNTYVQNRQRRNKHRGSSVRDF